MARETSGLIARVATVIAGWVMGAGLVGSIVLAGVAVLSQPSPLSARAWHLSPASSVEAR